MPWFQTEDINPGVRRFVETHVHSFYRSNLYRIEGRDFDVQLDFGVSVRSLTEVSPVDGHPHRLACPCRPYRQLPRLCAPRRPSSRGRDICHPRR